MWMSNRPAAPQSNIWKFLQKLHKYSLAQCSRDWAFNSLPTDGRAWQCFDGFEPSAIISGAADAIDAIFAIAHNFLHPPDSMICLCPLLPLTPDGRNISPRNIAIQFWTFLVCSMVCWASWFATFSDPESYFHLTNANWRSPPRLPNNMILSKSKCMRGNSKNFPRWDHPENWLFQPNPQVEVQPDHFLARQNIPHQGSELWVRSECWCFLFRSASAATYTASQAPRLPLLCGPYLLPGCHFGGKASKIQILKYTNKERQKYRNTQIHKYTTAQ